MWAYLRTTAAPSKGQKQVLMLKDGREFGVHADADGFHIDLGISHIFELSPPLAEDLLAACAYFTYYHTGYTSKPSWRLPDTGIYEYRSAKALLYAVNGAGYALKMRFEDYEDGKALFMAIWHEGIDVLTGVTVTPQALAA